VRGYADAVGSGGEAHEHRVSGAAGFLFENDLTAENYGG